MTKSLLSLHGRGSIFRYKKNIGLRMRVGVSTWRHGIIHNIGLNNARVGLRDRINERITGVYEPHRCLMNKLSDAMQSTKNNDKNRRMN